MYQVLNYMYSTYFGATPAAEPLVDHAKTTRFAFVLPIYDNKT